MEGVDIQGKIYPGFGRCIYCGSDGGTDGLRDEHIMPYCLGGNAVIEKASCKACEASHELSRWLYGSARLL